MEDDKQLTPEEIYLMVNDDELVNTYELYNLYSVSKYVYIPRLCVKCRLEYNHKNRHLFYDLKPTICITCCKKQSRDFAKNNPEKIKLYKERSKLNR